MIKRVIAGFIFLFSPYIEAQVELEEMVVVATRAAKPVSTIPSNITVLRSGDLERTSANHIEQLLSQVPGVTTQRGSGQESLPGIRSAVLTGAGACGSVLVMEEAIPVRSSGFCNVNELFDTNFEQATSFEVVRGPSTAFFGSNSLTGAVNVNLSNKGPNVLSLELGENSYARAKGAISYGSEGSGEGRVYFGLTDYGGFRENSGYGQQKLSWRHVQRINEWSLNAGVTVANLDQETAGFIVGLDSYRNEDLARQNLDPNAFREATSMRGWLRFSRALSNRRTVQVTPYFRANDMDFRLHFLPGDPLETNSHYSVGIQSSLTTAVSEGFNWALGFDVDMTEGSLLQTQDQPTLGSVFLRATIPVGTHYDYEVDALQVAAFSHLAWQVTKQSDLIAGVRLERLNFNYDNLALDGRTTSDGTSCGFGGCRYSRPADRRDTFVDLSPKIEWRYHISDKLRLYGSWADSFRAPQATELYRLQRGQTHADLDSVRAKNIEFGIRYSDEDTQVAVSAYRLHLENVIYRDSDFFNVDGNKIQSAGIELAVRHQLTDRWSINLSAAMSDHEYDSDQISGGVNINGNQVDTAPKTAASFSVRWESAAKLSAQLQLRHLSKYYLEPENQNEYPGHNVLNFQAQYRFNPQWKASMRVFNVTDASYAERADFTGFSGVRYFPGQPRSFFATLEYQFD